MQEHCRSECALQPSLERVVLVALLVDYHPDKAVLALQRPVGGPAVEAEVLPVRLREARLSSPRDTV